MVSLRIRGYFFSLIYTWLAVFVIYPGDKGFIQCFLPLINFSAGYTKVDSLLHFLSFLNYSGNPMQNSLLFLYCLFFNQLRFQGARVCIWLYFYFMFKKISAIYSVGGAHSNLVSDLWIYFICIFLLLFQNNIINEW